MPKGHDTSKKRLSLGTWGFPFKSSNGESQGQNNKQAGSIAQAKPTETAKNSTPKPMATKPNELVKAKASSTSTLIELAATITRETEKLDAYLKESGDAYPGFDVDAPATFPKLPEDLQKARKEVLRATKELGDLVKGPTESVRWLAWDVSLLPHNGTEVYTNHSLSRLMIPFPLMQSIIIRWVFLHPLVFSKLVSNG
jgi:hypothetical protein